jgi:hypothetical protein
MTRVLRRNGIAIGSLTIAWLAIALVGGIIGLTLPLGVFGVVVVLILGGLIYRDILGREQGPG